jgi:hypothetical protein
MPDMAENFATIRNEFALVTLRVHSYGRGTRLEVSSPLHGTSSMLDATILEAISRLDRETLAGLVPLGLSQWDEAK